MKPLIPNVLQTTFQVVNSSDGSNSVRCSKAKSGVRVRLPRDEHVQCPFDVRCTVRQTFSEHQIAKKNAFLCRNSTLFCNF